jgi:SAM-dependent methyltransferase
MIDNALNLAGLAFDSLAEDYDASFTRSHIGRAQRNVVWAKAAEVFRGNLSILELNCGTGEDALFLAAQGHRVTALDASRAMIERASTRKRREAPNAAIDIRLLPTERLFVLPRTPFDAVFSNFSGLNCVYDLTMVGEQLARRTLPGAPLLFCFSTRICLWETAWFLLQGKFRKAFRRWSGRSTATLNGIPVTVYYPTVFAIKRAFAPHIKLRSITGIGLLVPPSYLEPYIQNRPRLLALFTLVDKALCRLPILRMLGDHVLLHFERTAETGA